MAKFEKLWESFPEQEKVKAVCRNKQKTTNEPFGNYCAILLSECFIRSGVDLSLIRGSRCWSHNGKKHILKAEDIANGLKTNRPAGFGPMEKIPPNSFQSKLAGRTGVVFFKDYWQRSQESFNNRSGDHIDLWNQNRITNSSMFYRSIVEFFGLVSDLNKSKEIWFWEVK